MQEKHMQKIEELTLYVIELEKQNKKLQERLESIEALLNKSK
jgi:chaperonin cofactor prefoldin